MLNPGKGSVFSPLGPDFPGNSSSVLLYDGAYWLERYLLCYEVI